jgi:CRP/FNR family transcriptional regulator
MDDRTSFLASCEACGLNALCIPNSLTEQEIAIVDEVIERPKPIAFNKLVWNQGDKFTSIYVVRAGAVKLFSVDEGGDEYVIGFYLPGEILSMGALHSEHHENSAIALETTYVCEIEFGRLEELSSQIHNLQSYMYRKLSSKIQEDQRHQLLIGKRTARQRVASFLLDMSQRYQRRRLSPTSFRLPMSRTDIASYLALSAETISRVIAGLRKDDIVSFDGKDVDILDLHQLCETAHRAEQMREE